MTFCSVRDVWWTANFLDHVLCSDPNYSPKVGHHEKMDIFFGLKIWKSLHLVVELGIALLPIQPVNCTFEVSPYGPMGPISFKPEVGILEDQFHETGVYFKTSKIRLIFQVDSMCQMWHPLPFEQSNQMVSSMISSKNT